MLKMSDDTAIHDVLHRDQGAPAYQVDQFTDQCDAHHYTVNAKMTEEIYIDLKSIGDHSPVFITTLLLDRSPLGIYINSSLSWHVHVDTLCAKSQQRIYFLRRL